MVESLLVFLVLNFIIFFVVDFLVFKLNKKGWERFVVSFLIFISQILFSQFILGFFEVLNFWSLLSLNVFISSLIVLYCLRDKPGNFLKIYLSSYKKSLLFWKKTFEKEGLFAFLFVIFACLLAWISLLGFLFPVMDVDGNSYHMTYVAQVVQSDSIHDQPTNLTWLNGYPKGGELLQSWSVIIQGSDILSDLAQVPFILLGVVSLYALCRRFGASAESARFSSLLFLFVPILINQAKTTYVDVILTSLFFAGLAIATKVNYRKIDYFALGLVFSFLISIKSTGLLFVITILPFLIFSYYKKNKILSRNTILPVLIVISPLFFGFFWYIKNLVKYDTPIYPFGFSVFGKSIFEGKTFNEFIGGAFSNFDVMPEGMFNRLWFVWTEQEDWYGCLYNYDSTFSGLGPLWFIVLLPALISGFILSIRKKNYAYIVFSVLLVCLLLIYPANFYTRYILFIVGVGIVGFSLLDSEMSKRTKSIVRAVVIFICFCVIGSTFTLCTFSPASIREQINNIRSGNPRSSSVYQKTIGSSYLYAQNNVGINEVVVYSSKTYYIYPLWRNDFKNKVIYVPYNDQQSWEKNIREKNAKFIFTANNSKESKQMKLNPEKFQLLHKDENNEVFKVL